MHTSKKAGDVLQIPAAGIQTISPMKSEWQYCSERNYELEKAEKKKTTSWQSPQRYVHTVMEMNLFNLL